MATAESDRHVAYLEDADDGTGSCIEGTRKYATFEAESAAASRPPRQRPNVGRLITDPQPSTQRSPPSAMRSNFADSDSTHSSARSSDRRSASDGHRERRRPSDTRRQSHQSDPDREKPRKADRRVKEHGERPAKQERLVQVSKEASNSKKSRPAAPEHAASQPAVPQINQRRAAADAAAAAAAAAADNAQRYPQQHSGAMPSRPTPQPRPNTYYGGQPPYHVPMGWHPSPYPPHAYVGPSGASPLGPPPSHPPPHPMRYPGPGMQLGPMPPPSPVDAPGYYGNPQSPMYPDPLRQRFDMRGPAMPPPPRPEPSPTSYGPGDYGDEDAPRISRRDSRSKRHDEDKRRMPPPQRPMSAMPQSTQPFYPPNAPRPQVRQSASRPPATHRRSVGFADEYEYHDYDSSHARFQDISPEPAYDRRRYVEVPRQSRGSQLYSEKCDVIPASRRGRRASMYGTGALGPGGVSFEQEYKYSDAMAYQNAINGGPTTPLTAESLRKATRVPSSRSTRSSGSRDESEHRRSYTTGITRSSSGNGKDVTIKVDGAILTVPAGAEITLSSRPSGSRSGSDRASTVYQLEDGRGRSERLALPHRSRAPSQSDSHGRGYMPNVYSQYEQGYTDGNYI